MKRVEGICYKDNKPVRLEIENGKMKKLSGRITYQQINILPPV